MNARVNNSDNLSVALSNLEDKPGETYLNFARAKIPVSLFPDSDGP